MIRFQTSLFVLVLLLAASGCTTVATVPAATAPETRPADAVALVVGLYLPPDYKNYTWRESFQGDVHVTEFGPSLTASARNIAESIFSNVKMLDSDSKDAAADVDAILSPRIAQISSDPRFGNYGKTFVAWTKVRFTIEVEWTLATQDGEVIWTDTLTGTGESDLGGLGSQTSNREERALEAVESLFAHLHTAMKSAEEINVFMTRRETSRYPPSVAGASVARRLAN